MHSPPALLVPDIRHEEAHLLVVMFSSIDYERASLKHMCDTYAVTSGQALELISINLASANQIFSSCALALLITMNTSHLSYLHRSLCMAYLTVSKSFISCSHVALLPEHKS